MITIESAAPRIRALLREIDDDRIVLLTVVNPDIRQQLSIGIQNTNTKLVVLVDDDSKWSKKTLEYLTASFTDPVVGGANTMQMVHGRYRVLTLWESYGALNLVRRNVLHSYVAFFNSGQVLNLSGRTVAYRTSILQNEEFFTAFLNDYWRGKYLLRTGDDSFITSWIVRRGWKTSFLNQPDAIITTTVNDDFTYLKQVLRWSRDTARHYLRDALFAIRTGRSDMYVRSALNWTANYATDFAVFGEVVFLAIVSLCRIFGIKAINRGSNG